MLFSIEPWIIKGETFENSNWIMFGVGFVFFAIGLYLVTSVEDFNRPDKSMYVCESCEKTSKHTGEDAPICKVCQKRMEPLDGFFDRHPEERGQATGT
jgi:hypothetical protein